MNNNWRFVLGWPFHFAMAMLFRLLAPCFRGARESGRYPWVIGGHRGRMHADNAGALHAYVAGHTSQPIVWIAAYESLARELRSKGYTVLMKNSFQARLALLRAPVLVYSHGEDDLDLFMNRFRSCLGMRVYLNHSLNHLKMGQYERPGVDEWPARKRKGYIFRITDFDVLLASSPEEKKHFDKAFRYRTKRILPYGGGAHLDGVLEAAQGTPERLLVWFPTFRDSKPEQQGAAAMMASVAADASLHAYLEREDLRLALVGHINTDTRALPAEGSARISYHDPSEILALLSRASCFLTDYSGLLFDWMCFGRPVIHFPFDEESYVRSRNLCNSLSDLQYGPMVHTQAELMEVLDSNAWRDMGPYAERRAYWMKTIFPGLRPGYAQRCYETIVEKRKAFSEAQRPCQGAC